MKNTNGTPAGENGIPAGTDGVVVSVENSSQGKKAQATRERKAELLKLVMITGEYSEEEAYMLVYGKEKPKRTKGYNPNLLPSISAKVNKAGTTLTKEDRRKQVELRASIYVASLKFMQKIGEVEEEKDALKDINDYIDENIVEEYLAYCLETYRK